MLGRHLGCTCFAPSQLVAPDLRSCPARTQPVAEPERRRNGELALRASSLPARVTLQRHVLHGAGRGRPPGRNDQEGPLPDGAQTRGQLAKQQPARATTSVGEPSRGRDGRPRSPPPVPYAAPSRGWQPRGTCSPGTRSGPASAKGRMTNPPRERTGPSGRARSGGTRHTGSATPSADGLGQPRTHRSGP
jgi:hypothetical protein